MMNRRQFVYATATTAVGAVTFARGPEVQSRSRPTQSFSEPTMT